MSGFEDEIDFGGLPGIGDNLPPFDLEAALPPDLIAALLDDKFGKLRVERDALQSKYDAMPGALNAGTAPVATDFVRRIAACIADAADTHAAVKKPVLAAYRQIDAAKLEVTSPMEACGQGVRAKLLAFQRAEEARLRAEKEAEAARLPPEEAAQKAAEPVSASVRTNTGGVATRKQKWVWRVSNMPEFLQAALDGKIGFQFVEVCRPVMDAYVREHKGTTAIPGITVEDEGSIAIR